ncbi:hypothetical protein [Hyphomicrobium sp. DY-1]|uniref:hypothetical protein n=1 Tax=Hyphomicrobium sp. DY-1 TaxID=3075650 RepID=UPI0039C0C7D5
MRIDVQDLTEFNVETDGRSVTLHVVDTDGTPAAVNLQVAQLGMLAMSLPNFIDAAIQVQYGDASCRFTYPLASWVVDQALDPSLLIVTLKTSDGFGVRFSLPRQKADEMSESLAMAAQKEVELLTH